ncbi:MAG: PrsW family glutamic-type intramembrane protease [Candidatus Freyarchaeum deiterrae]
MKKLDTLLAFITGIAICILVPLAIWLLMKKLRFEQEPYRYLLAAFILGYVVILLALIGETGSNRLFARVPLYGYVLYLLPIGFIEEAAKLLVLLIPFIRRRMNERNGAFYGMVVGLGFAGGEDLTYLMSFVLSYYPIISSLLYDLTFLNVLVTLPQTPQTLLLNLYYLPGLISNISSLLTELSLFYLGPSLLGLPLIGIFGRAPALLFHASSAAIIGYGLVRGKTLKYYLAAVLLHILFDSTQVLTHFGSIGALAASAMISALSVGLFVYVFYTTFWTVKPLESKISRDRAGKA